MAKRALPRAKMPRVLSRQAREADFPFALDLYLASVEPLLRRLGAWDETRVRKRLRQLFRPELVRIVRLAGNDIGWIQIATMRRGLHLDQLHLLPKMQGRGLGTRLIVRLQDRARRRGQAIGLNVIRGNPAIELYRRLGFKVLGGDRLRLRMRWRPTKPSLRRRS